MPPSRKDPPIPAPARAAFRAARPDLRATATHRFTVGQAVRMVGGPGVAVARSGDVFLVTALLPPRGDALQYRIRNAGELHERVTTEDSLEAVAAEKPNEGATLRRLMFGSE